MPTIQDKQQLWQNLVYERIRCPSFSECARITVGAYLGETWTMLVTPILSRMLVRSGISHHLDGAGPPGQRRQPPQKTLWSPLFTRRALWKKNLHVVNFTTAFECIFTTAFECLTDVTVVEDFSPVPMNLLPNMRRMGCSILLVQKTAPMVPTKSTTICGTLWRSCALYFMVNFAMIRHVECHLDSNYASCIHPLSCAIPPLA